MKNRLMLMLMIVGLAVLAFSSLAAAQGTPQWTTAAKPAPTTPDGKPDFSGTWRGAPGRREEPMQLTPWGIDKFVWNKEPAAPMTGGESRVELDPVFHCYPAGAVRLGPPLQVPGGFRHEFQILRGPNRILILHPFNHERRQIFVDGREHPKDLADSWNGHSIGRWDGDTLVVDTVGLRDETWLDNQGHEHSDQLHIVERIRRLDHGTLEIERTLIDPVALAKPFTTRTRFELIDDFDIDERMGGQQTDCNQYWRRTSYFGEGKNGLLQIGDHPARHP